MQDSWNHTHENKHTQSRRKVPVVEGHKILFWWIKFKEWINNGGFCQPSRMDQNKAKACCTSVNPFTQRVRPEPPPYSPWGALFWDYQIVKAGIGNRERVHHLSTAPNIRKRWHTKEKQNTKHTVRHITWKHAVTHRTPYEHSYTEKRSAPFLLSLLFFFLPQTVLHFTTPFFICWPSSQYSVPQTHNLSIWPSCFHFLIFGCIPISTHSFLFCNPLTAVLTNHRLFFLILSSGLFFCLVVIWKQ